MEKFGIGQGIRRHEDLRFLTGEGTYIDDITHENMAHAVILRSPHAHAEIESIDSESALAMPGVLLVVTGEDWVREGYGTMPTKSAVNKKIDGSPLNQPPRHALAIDTARYAGEPVALIVAETRAQAVDAAEAVDVTYEELDAVIDPIKALEPGAPQIWDDIPGNFCLDFELGDKDATEAAFQAADHVVSLDIENNRVTAVPLETRGAIASYDPETDSFLLENATQNVHANRATFAGNVLKIAEEKLHHVAPMSAAALAPRTAPMGTGSDPPRRQMSRPPGQMDQ